MALKKDYVNENGLTCPNAYIRVDQIDLNKSGMTAMVRWQKDSSAAWFDEKRYQAPYDLAGANAISQAYNHLKTLPEFQGAADC